MNCGTCNSVLYFTISDIVVSAIPSHSYAARIPSNVCSKCGNILYDQDKLSSLNKLIAIEMINNFKTGKVLRYVREIFGINKDQAIKKLRISIEQLDSLEIEDHFVDSKMWRVIGGFVRVTPGEFNNIEFLGRVPTV